MIIDDNVLSNKTSPFSIQTMNNNYRVRALGRNKNTNKNVQYKYCKNETKKRTILDHNKIFIKRFRN